MVEIGHLAVGVGAASFGEARYIEILHDSQDIISHYLILSISVRFHEQRETYFGEKLPRWHIS